jgi:DNA-binding LacI/PurR family transcriptional regulator
MSQIAAPRRGLRGEIKDRILAWIRAEGLRPGEQILPQLRLAERFGTTEVTVHRALTELAEEGMVRRVRGRGTFVGPRIREAPQSRAICFVLPGDDLDRPERNPEYWPYVQTMLRAFIHRATAGQRPFAVRGVKQEEADGLAGVAGELETYGAVFFSYVQEPRPLIRLLLERGRVPVAVMGRPDPELDCLTIDHDRVLGTQRAVHHLGGLGYRRIGFLGSRCFWGSLAREGYLAGLAHCGLAAEAGRTVASGEARAEAAAAAAELLAAAPDCDAILADSDLRALGVLDHLQAAGVAVPEAMGVMGYDGLDYTAFGPPHLTSVQIPFDGLIASALEEVERAPGRRTPRKHIELVGEVVSGRTVRRQAPAPG